MAYQSVSVPRGELGLYVIRSNGVPNHESPWPNPGRPLSRQMLVEFGLPKFGLSREVNAWRRGNARRLVNGSRKIFAAQALHIPSFYGQLYLSVERETGEFVDLGLAGVKMVTTVGVKFLTDDIAGGASDINTIKFHGFGTGAGAEAVGNTALTTEVTNTTYVGDVRPTGTQVSATVVNDATYTSVATYSPDSGTPIAVTEHGLFSANATGTLWDKTLFSVVTLATGDSLQATYVCTFTAGG